MPRRLGKQSTKVTAHRAFACAFPRCKFKSTSQKGLTLHVKAKHTVPEDLQPELPAPPHLQTPVADPASSRLQTPDPLPQTPPHTPISHPPTSSSPTSSPNAPSTPHASPRRDRTPLGSPRRPYPGPRVNSAGIHIKKHPYIDGTPCDVDGYELEPDARPPTPPPQDSSDYSPFDTRAEFELSEWIFTTAEISASKIDQLMHILTAMYPDQPPPAAKHIQIYEKIDAVLVGDVAWSSFTVKYNGPTTLGDDGKPPVWMTQDHEVWFRDPLLLLEGMIANPDFNGEIDFGPKIVTKDGKRRYKNVMSGKWAWDQADILAQDKDCHGAMFVPVILGSDKTTVSVATGQTDFYPLYTSIGNVHNSVRRAHRGAVALVGFLAIPKSSKEYSNDAQYRKFRRQLFHTSLEHILGSVRPYMSKPKVTLCGDGHYRKVIYGLGPYIADYPEQALLACIVQGWCPKCTALPDKLDDPGGSRRSHEHTDTLLDGCTLKELWDDYGIVGDLLPFTKLFPRADIHELLTPDLLHQVIKGTFKDHLVDWVESYIRDVMFEGNPKGADAVIADIDRRIACAPPFPGLRHFHEGRGFKQWTGNDSKGLMKVYLPAIAGHLPDQMVRAIANLIEFCYLARRDILDEDTLDQMDSALSDFHENREIFRSVRPDGFSLPRQHSLVHYRRSIELFGAPNGVCSSITENKHIKAVKRPYRRSNRNKPLGQMLVTNQRLDKLAAARVDFEARGMLRGSGLPIHLLGEAVAAAAITIPPPKPAPKPDDDERMEFGAVDEPMSQSEVKLAKTAVRKVPIDIYQFARCVHQGRLPELTCRYLYDILNPKASVPGSRAPLDILPTVDGPLRLFNSVRAVYYAPSDLSGIGGMHEERIRAVRKWYNGPPRYDCVFVGNTDAADQPGFRGLNVARVRVFFSFQHKRVIYPCALVHWFSHVGNAPDPVTGMWKVKPDYDRRGNPILAVIAVDSIFRGAHLIGVCGMQHLPRHGFDHSKALDSFKTFYVNKYADHHTHEIAF
ncbi:hypothetical protein CPB84DRAFT_1854424 [Gymnopilus junonius]|uniref:C2H2-type domain-containing protein n=1 Tax=Gymnopilus junonius TaxID=109634 RepID=A0A9P5NA73_GYMJU|nr:hypothetical protein CPB84DRAFT_1854424 [Gymnopilus junonius]